MTTSPQKSSERRDGPRIDLRLRVRWSAKNDGDNVSGEAEASDVSPRGLRLESEHDVKAGSPLHLIIDVGGDTEELVAEGQVMWCRHRPSPTGRPLFDIGVSFESDWLAKQRSPLGNALARIFAMNDYEPARTFARTGLGLAVDGTAFGGPLALVNLSQGGMQLKSTGQLAQQVRAGMRVEVVVEAAARAVTLAGKVAWVAAAAEGKGGEDRFGVEFAGPGEGDNALLEAVCTGQTEAHKIALSLRA
ncbi:MAG: PilZ domain-containing protein [Deltaproteobacteria bacterium]|nr:PilZ domain-containing protein [Deltaproteobacteria bacterium]